MCKIPIGVGSEVVMMVSNIPVRSRKSSELGRERAHFWESMDQEQPSDLVFDFLILSYQGYDMEVTVGCGLSSGCGLRYSWW